MAGWNGGSRMPSRSHPNSEVAGPVPIGPKSQEMLAMVGVTSIGELMERGAVETYLDVIDAGWSSPSLNLLWGLEAVLEGIHWRDISPERKAQLRAEVDRQLHPDQT